MITWLLVALALSWLFRIRSGGSATGRLFVSSVLFVLTAWAVLDVRWSSNNLRQIKVTMEQYWGLEEQEKLGRGLDGDLFREIERVTREILPRDAARILLVGGDIESDYALLRAKYHVLPHSTHAVRQLPANLESYNLDYVLLLGPMRDVSTIADWSIDKQKMLKKVDASKLTEVYELH